MPELIDVYTPCEPGGLMRSTRVVRRGLYRLARRDAELYSVQIIGSGSWGRARLLDANRVMWEQPSTFTGSFWLGGGARGQMVVELYASSEHDAANLTINWREKDRHLV